MRNNPGGEATIACVCTAHIKLFIFLGTHRVSGYEGFALV
jgi:hypothetical protein